MDNLGQRRCLRTRMCAASALSSLFTLSAWAGVPVIETAKIDEYMTRQLEEERYPSLSIGIVHDQNLVFAKAYGAADLEGGRQATPDSLYPIGSVTKVFTTTLMCILRDQGRLRLDDPVSQYLPDSVELPTDPRGARAITLCHLATHSSGLPRLPPNLQPKGGDAYGGYTLSQLYEGLSVAKLAYPTGAKYLYSNLGVGLLGHVLERATGEPYEQMITKYLLDPLGMAETGVKLSTRQRAMLTKGYQGEDLRDEAPDWDLGCLVGAGGLTSSVTDLARFLSLQMRAGQANVEPVSGGALTELHTPQRLDEGWDVGVGLGWHITPIEQIGDIVWHNGGVAGHFAYIGFVQKHKIGVIALTNGGKSVDAVGLWLLETAVESAKSPTSQPDRLPSAEEVIDWYITATGGAEPRTAIQNAVTRGKGDMMGLAVEYESYQAAPAKFYMRMYAGAVNILEQGTDGETAWQRAPLAGAGILTGEEREQFLRDAFLHADVKWRELYKAAGCTEMAEFGGRRCFKVVMTPNSGADEVRYYDVKSHLLIGTETTFEMLPIKTVADDYREFDGILYPRKVTQSILGMDMTFTVESVEHNADIPADRFDLPPDVKKLAVRKNTTRPQQDHP